MWCSLRYAFLLQGTLLTTNQSSEKPCFSVPSFIDVIKVIGYMICPQSERKQVSFWGLVLVFCDSWCWTKILAVDLAPILCLLFLVIYNIAPKQQYFISCLMKSIFHAFLVSNLFKGLRLKILNRLLVSFTKKNIHTQKKTLLKAITGITRGLIIPEVLPWFKDTAFGAINFNLWTCASANKIQPYFVYLTTSDWKHIATYSKHAFSKLEQKWGRSSK